jgi:hypothetical protein
MKLPIIVFVIIFIFGCKDLNRQKIDTNKRKVYSQELRTYNPSKTDLFYYNYRNQNGKVGFGSLDDNYLKTILEPYFTLNDSIEYPEHLIYYPLSKNDSNKYTFSTDSGEARFYKVEMMIRSFDSSDHKISRGENNYIYLIDDKVLWGAGNYIPEKEISSFKILFNDEIVNLPESEYKDVYNMEVIPTNNIQAAMDKKKKYFFIIIWGSDTTEGYCAIWIFKDGKYIRRVVDFPR